MSVLSERFGELRSVLAEAPSAQSWQALGALLDALADEAPAQLDEQVMPYVLAALDAWPAALREAPDRWLRAAAQQPSPPAQLRACATLTIKPSATANDKQERQLAQVVCGPSCAQVERLNLRNAQLKPLRLTALVQAPIAASLRALDVSSNTLSDAEIEALGRLERLVELRASYVTSRDDDGGARTRTGDEGTRIAMSLARGGRLAAMERIELAGDGDKIGSLLGASRLKELAIWSSDVGDQGAEALARAAMCATLEVLNVGGCGLSDAGVRALCLAPLTRLRSLYLWQSQLTSASVPWLRHGRFGETLEELHLTSCTLGPALGELGLASWPKLERLFISHNGAVGDAWRGELWRQLKVLHAARCGLGQGGMDALCAAIDGGRMEVLELSNNALGRDDAERLAKIALPHLKRLLLNESPGLTRQVSALTRAPWFAGLEALMLSHSALTDDDLLALGAHMPPQLKHLDIQRHQASAATLMWLERQLPPGAELMR